MVLNASRLIPALRSRYCGIALYLSNSACQAAWSSGGSTPVTGFHSTIESPDSVSRVAPPTTTVTTISAATASSHSLTARRCADAGGGTRAMGYGRLAGDGTDHIVALLPPAIARGR